MQRISEARIPAKLYVLLTALLDSGDITNAREYTHCPIAPALRFTQEHFSQPMTLANITDSVNMRQYHFHGI